MNSLLHQSYAHIDYVIIDGASTDGTPEMLGKTEGVRWISEPDMGIYDAMNKGIRMAEGEWVIFMNAGDVFASDDTLSKVFSVERDADVIYGDVIKGDSIKKAEPPHNGHRMYFCHQRRIIRQYTGYPRGGQLERKAEASPAPAVHLLDVQAQRGLVF